MAWIFLFGAMAMMVSLPMASAHGSVTLPRSRNVVAADAQRFYDVDSLRTAASQLTGLEDFDQLPWPQNNPGSHVGVARPLSPCGTYPDNTGINGGNEYNFNALGNYWGDVQTVYEEGEEVTLTWESSQNHLGSYSYRVCDYVQDLRDIQDECYATPMLKEVGTGREWLEIQNEQSELNITHRFQLPDGLTCDRCVLVWRWDSLLTHEVWHNCADISIVGLGGPPNPTPAPAPTPGTPTILPTMPPTTRPPTPPLPTGCYSVSPSVPDSYCDLNCNYTPPFCPPDLCRCD